MTLLETGRTQAETLLRYGLTDEQVQQRTGATFLDLLELRAEAAVRPADRVLLPTTGASALPEGRGRSPCRGRACS